MKSYVVQIIEVWIAELCGCWYYSNGYSEHGSGPDKQQECFVYVKGHLLAGIMSQCNYASELVKYNTFGLSERALLKNIYAPCRSPSRVVIKVRETVYCIINAAPGPGFHI